LKRIALASLVLVIGVFACKDVVTSPQLNVDTEGQFANASNPPPPPLDTGARGRFLPGATLRAEPTPRFFSPRFSVDQPLPTQPRTSILGLPTRLANEVIIDPFDFNLPVTYNLSQDGLKGQLSFRKINGSHAVLKACNVKLNNGVFTGSGFLQVQTTGGLLIIDCSSVNQELSWFEPCGDRTVVGERCFHLVFDYATLDGVPGRAQVMVGCTPDDIENEACEFPPNEIIEPD
jgi:hypothetical protein